MIQFSKYAKPDKSSGYTADDNARALIACVYYYRIFKDKSVLKFIRKYLNVIDFLKNDFKFYNIINSNKQVISNEWSGDAHGRTLWALGFLIDTDEIPINIRNHAERLFKRERI